MKYSAPLKTKDIVSLTGLIIIGFAWMMIDQFFLKQSSHRFIAFAIIMILLFTVQYWVNKPLKIWRYANSIALILLVFVIISSFVMHVLINHDFMSKLTHSVLLWIIVGVMPYVGGILYSIIRKE